MKILATILIGIISASTPISSENVYGYIQENTPLLNENYQEVFLLPRSYFVYILYETQTHYKVSYLDKTGYVHKEHIKKVDYTPKYKYYLGKISLVNDGNTINLRSSPDHTQANILTKVNEGEIAFYGPATGSEQIPSLGKQWYYVKYTTNSSNYYGYIYNVYCPLPPSPPENTIEKEEKVKEDVEFVQGEITPLLSVIIIASLCVPVLIIMYLIFSPPKKRE